MRLTVTVLLASAVLAGCAAYQPGDATRAALDARAEYCATADPDRRKALLAVLHALNTPVPSNGVCTSLVGLAARVAGGE